MSFLGRTISFSTIKIVGDLPEHRVVQDNVRKVPYVAMGPNETYRVGLIDPLAELEPDFSNPYVSPISARYLMFDMIIQRRIPDSRLVTRISKTRVDEEIKCQRRHNPTWSISKQKVEEIRAQVEMELALKVNPTVSRIAIMIDLSESMLLTTARRGTTMDAVVEMAKAVLGEGCLFYDHFCYDFNQNTKRLIPFGISDNQSRPPKDEGQWLREFVTWVAASSLSHTGDTETDDMMRVTFPGKQGKSMSIKSQHRQSEVDDFCIDAISDGGIVVELSMLLAGDFFRDNSQEIRFKIGSTGYVSGIKPGIKAADRVKNAWLIADGSFMIAGKLAKMAKDFLEKRQSAKEWGVESAKIRKLLGIRNQIKKSEPPSL